MATRSPRFTAMPTIPFGSENPAQDQLVTAMRENLELLIGARGAVDNRAVLRGQVTISQLPPQTMVRVSATGAGFTIEGAGVASAVDHVALINDVQELANDVATLRRAVEVLINQLRGSS